MVEISIICLKEAFQEDLHKNESPEGLFLRVWVPEIKPRHPVI